MAHALLSPSAAHRWLNCTAAPRLEEHEEDRGSAYAEEGSLAHAYCARLLKRYLGQPAAAEDEEIKALDHYHSAEMDEHAEDYAATVIGMLEEKRKGTPDAKLLVETRLDFSEWVPEAFGTADAIIVAEGCIEVIDFKYGKGVRVDAENNPQMMIYALGAMLLYDMEYGIYKVGMTIVQPRLGHVSRWETDAESLVQWANGTLRPRAKEAWKGGSTLPGDWCRFCKVRPKCKALARMAQMTQANFSNPRILTAEQLAENVLPYLDTIKAWVSSVEEYALQRALDGTQFKGWKVVEGRSVRRIVDPDAAAKALSGEGYSLDAIYKPKELKGIGDLEKLVGKKHLAEIIGEHIAKPQGKPALVPESDKRPPMNSAADDFKDINFD